MGVNTTIDQTQPSDPMSLSQIFMRHRIWFTKTSEQYLRKSKFMIQLTDLPPPIQNHLLGLIKHPDLCVKTKLLYFCTIYFDLELDQKEEILK